MRLGFGGVCVCKELFDSGLGVCVSGSEGRVLATVALWKLMVGYPVQRVVIP